MAWKSKDFLDNFHAFPEFIYGLANEPESFRSVLALLRKSMKVEDRDRLLVDEQIAHLDRDEFKIAAEKVIGAFGGDGGMKAGIISIWTDGVKEAKRPTSQQHQQRPLHTGPSRVDSVPPPLTPVPMPPRVDPLPPPTYIANPPPPAFNIYDGIQRDAALAEACSDGVLRDVLNRLIQTCLNKELGLDNGDSLGVSDALRCLDRNRSTDCCNAVSEWARGKFGRARALALALSEKEIPAVCEKK